MSTVVEHKADPVGNRADVSPLSAKEREGTASAYAHDLYSYQPRKQDRRTSSNAFVVSVDGTVGTTSAEESRVAVQQLYTHQSDAQKTLASLYSNAPKPDITRQPSAGASGYDKPDASGQLRGSSTSISTYSSTGSHNMSPELPETTPEHLAFRQDALRHADWNEAFIAAQCLPESTPEEVLSKYEKLTQLSTDFIGICQVYGRTIISEYFLPKTDRSVQTDHRFGGLAGGDKFVVRGILFKLSRDVKLANGSWLYGGDEGESYECAAKAAGHDLRGTTTIDQKANSMGLHVPMCCLVDYHGFRMVCMPVLPLARFIYGSADAGRTIRTEIPAFNALIERVASELHVSPHFINQTVVYMAGDVEGHLGKDGHLLDLARTFPPEAPGCCHHLPFSEHSVFFRFLRPEFLQYLKQKGFPALSADALTGWGQMGPDAEQHNSRVTDATRILLEEVIPAFVNEICNLQPEEWASFELRRSMHAKGINIRHLGYIFNLVQKRREPQTDVNTAEGNGLLTVEKLVLREIVVRTLKNMLRAQLRDVANMKVGQNSASVGPSIYYSKRRICDFLNCVTGSAPVPITRGFWSEDLPAQIVGRFGRLNMLPNSKGSSDTVPLFEYFSDSITNMVEYVTVQCGIGFTSGCENQFRLQPLGFEFVTVDLADMNARVLHMSLIDYARAKVFSQEAYTKAKRTGNCDRLLALAVSNFDSALKSEPLNADWIRQAQLSRLRSSGWSYDQKGMLEEADDVFLQALDSALEWAELANDLAASKTGPAPAITGFPSANQALIAREEVKNLIVELLGIWKQRTFAFRTIFMTSEHPSRKHRASNSMRIASQDKQVDGDERGQDQAIAPPEFTLALSYYCPMPPTLRPAASYYSPVPQSIPRIESYRQYSYSSIVDDAPPVLPPFQGTSGAAASSMVNLATRSPFEILASLPPPLAAVHAKDLLSGSSPESASGTNYYQPYLRVFNAPRKESKGGPHPAAAPVDIKVIPKPDGIDTTAKSLENGESKEVKGVYDEDTAYDRIQIPILSFGGASSKAACEHLLQTYHRFEKTLNDRRLRPTIAAYMAQTSISDLWQESALFLLTSIVELLKNQDFTNAWQALDVWISLQDTPCMDLYQHLTMDSVTTSTDDRLARTKLALQELIATWRGITIPSDIPEERKWQLLLVRASICNALAATHSPYLWSQAFDMQQEMMLDAASFMIYTAVEEASTRETDTRSRIVVSFKEQCVQAISTPWVLQLLPRQNALVGSSTRTQGGVPPAEFKTVLRALNDMNPVTEVDVGQWANRLSPEQLVQLGQTMRGSTKSSNLVRFLRCTCDNSPIPVESVRSNFGELHEIVLAYASAEDMAVAFALLSCNNVVSTVKVTHSPVFTNENVKVLADFLLPRLKVTGASLESFEISESRLTDEQFRAFAPFLWATPSLGILNVSKNELSEQSILSVSLLPNLVTLNLAGVHLSSTALLNLARGCKALTSLDLSFCSGLDYAGVDFITNGLEQLSSLSLERANSEFLEEDNIAEKPTYQPPSQRRDRDKSAFSPLASSTLGLCSRLKGLKRLNLRDNVMLEDADLILIAQYCGNMEELILEGCAKLTDQSLNQVAQKLGPKLVVLNVNRVTLLRDSILMISATCPNLKTLGAFSLAHLTDRALSHVARQCVHLEDLNIGMSTLTDISLLEIARNCQLKSLSMYYSNKLTDAGVCAIARRSSQLVHVDVSRCMHVGDDFLQALAANCKELEFLNLCYDWKVTSAGLIAVARNCPLLRVLYICGCRRVGSSALTELARFCPRLEELDIRDLTQLSATCISSIARSCALKEIAASGVLELDDSVLKDFAAYDRALVSAIINRCPRITDEGVKALVDSCQLTNLHLASCINVSPATVKYVSERHPACAVYHWTY